MDNFKIDKVQTEIEKNAKKKLVDTKRAKTIDKRVDAMLERDGTASKKEYDYDFYKFVDNFNILTVTMGTIIAFSMNTVIQELVRDTVVPIFMNLIDIDKFYVFGIALNAERVIGNFLYLLLVIVIVTFIFRFVLKNTTGRLIKDKELTKLVDKEIRYREIILLEQMQHNLTQINRKMAGRMV
jgi:large-conductance mechanosensitive channel